MAVIKIPRGYQQGLWEERRPRGNVPRGPLWGGPERSAHDPQRTPRGGLCGGPARSANEPQTPPNKTTLQRSKEERAKKPREKTRPTTITIEETWNGVMKERRWGPLSRANAWRVGSFWEDMNRDLKVFLDKDGERKEAEIEKVIRSGRARFMICEKPQHHQEGSGRKAEEAGTTEKNNGVEEVPPEEIQTERMMWLAEKATSLEKENEEMK